MIDVVLAAGYATRMYPLTENFPKPLLEIKGKAILDNLLEDIDSIDEVSEHVIVTNHKFFRLFCDWKERTRLKKAVTIIDDGSVDNDHRVGAVRDLILAIGDDSSNDYLVVAADNILDFSLQGFSDFFREKGSSVIMCYNEPSIKALQRTGVITVDDEDLVLEMEEKPQCPKSNLAVPPFYIYSHSDLELIKNCIENGCGFDAPGNLACYLCRKTTVHAYHMPGKRLDIGDLETYYKIR